MREIYKLYKSCFPDYYAREKAFNHFIVTASPKLFAEYDYNNDKPVAFAMTCGNAVSLLCTAPEHRKKGIGSKLLAKAESHIKENGAKTIVLGEGKSKLLQGAPEETSEFFVKRGYKADWTSVNMKLDLESFDESVLDKSFDDVAFRFSTTCEKAELINAVNDAQPAWADIFKGYDEPVFVAVRNGRIIGFEIISTDDVRFAKSEKSGNIGCVGVVKSERKAGIGRRLVLEGARQLKWLGCAEIELRYVALEKWYEKMGFTTQSRQWMGRKSV